MSSVYRKGQVLGWGCFSTVFKGWDELLDRPVAVKELIQPFAGNESFVRAYLGQALRMVDIAHPHVLATYAIEPNRMPPALTRELADETLAHQLIEGPIAPEAVLRILRHALTGLGAIHDRDLLHRSIKPENLFACGNLYKVGDFGIPAVEGSPPFPLRQLKYMAPETFSEEGQPGPGSDVYSLGLVIHELLLGSVRFERIVEETLRNSGIAGENAGDEEEPEGMERLWPLFHLSSVPLPPIHELETSIPVALSLTLQKMVAKVPMERYGSCREVLAALGAAGLVEPFGGSQTLVLFPPSPPASPPPQRGRSSLILGGGVVTALVVAGTALILGVRSREGNVPATAPSTQEQEVSDFSPSGGDTPTLKIDRAGLASRLRSLQGDQDGLTLALDPPQRADRARLPLGMPIRFRVASGQTVHAALFVLSSDGFVSCIYPGPTGRTLRLKPGRGVLLPLPEDETNGFTMTATPPIGRDLVFLLTSEEPLPPLPVGETSEWDTSYSLVPGDPKSPALRFADWVAKVRRNAGTGLLVYEVEVVEGS
ncbi:MAG TPA: serine/threonine-protein kinase [Thermoanaerobaculia bacterium]|nr:serine/threonine-protein kinase [Thermoanaerobaculia bacterium]